MIEVRVEGRVRITTFSGSVDSAELLGHIDRLTGAPGFDPTLDSLVDLRALTDLAFDGKDVGEVDRRFRRAVPVGVSRRMAIVASSPITYGYARSFEGQHGDADEIRIFDDMAAARAWIGLSA